MGATVYYSQGHIESAPANNKQAEWNDATRTYTAWNEAGEVTETRSYTADENAALDAGRQQVTTTENRATLTARGITAIQDNLTWLNNVLPQIQAGVDAIQAKTWPNKPAAASNIAGVNTILSNQWDNVLTPLVAQVADLSRAVETLAQERRRSAEIEVALIRLVLNQLDSTEGA